VRVDLGFTPVPRPVSLQYRRQRYYGRLHRAIAERIEAAVRELLGPRRAGRVERRRVPR
jgi:hypothetical protein